MHGPVASHWLCEDAVAHRYSVEVVELDVMMGKSDGDGVGHGVGGQVGAMAAVGLNVLGKSGVGDGGGVGHGVGGKV
jgi:hypothetical protein